jgi:cytoskeleton protein RodZ
MKMTTGQKLRSKREQLGISLEDAARETHIRLNYLQELENDHPELLHSPTQAYGFLRLYAAYLKIPSDELTDKTEEAAPVQEIPAVETETPEPAEAADVNQEKPVESKRGRKQKSQRKLLPLEGIRQRIHLKKIQLPAGLAAGVKRVSDRIARFEPIKRFLKSIRELRDAKQVDRKNRELGQAAKSQMPGSEDIFKEIGQALLSRRQMMQLGLSDIENFTNLKRMYLVAIEDGRFGDLPSSVQGRGMLNIYAKFLGMDESAVMDQYGRALQIQREERLATQRKPAAAPVTIKLNLPENWRKIINPDLLIGSVLILGLFAFIIWGAAQVLGGGQGSSTEAPSISEMLQMTPSISPSADLTQAAGTEQPTEESTAMPGVAIIQSTPTAIATVNAAPLQVYIIANDRSYLQVTVYGEEAFRERTVPNNAYTFSGNKRIDLIAGNGAALEVYFNQEYLGKLGDVGQVINLSFTQEGLKTPTPQATSTPTPESVPSEANQALTGQ